jgi:Domain of unknown function (DUF1772)
MARQIANFLLIASMIAWSLWFGGLMYETTVVMPVWSASLPTSVLEWNSRPDYVINPTRFFLPVALSCVFLSIAAAIAARKFVTRKFSLFLSAACSTGALVFTLAYFFSRNDVLFRGQGIGLSGEQISVIAYEWIFANWIRVAVMAVGFVGAIRAYGSEAGTVDPETDRNVRF